MSAKLIVLTGTHKIVRTMVSADIDAFGEIPYYPSILDDLKRRGAPGHWETCPFFDDLLMHREIDRDSAIVPLLKKTQPIAFIEQWHIGNIAWAKAHSLEVGHEYEGKLPALLRSFEGIDIELWYISTNLEKMTPSAVRREYRAYLRELSILTKRFQLPTETIDGEAPADFVNRRIVHLLARKRRAIQ